MFEIISRNDELINWIYEHLHIFPSTVDSNNNDSHIRSWKHQQISQKTTTKKGNGLVKL